MWLEYQKYICLIFKFKKIILKWFYILFKILI